MVIDRPHKKHGLTLSMRTPTAKIIEEYVVDWTYGTKGERLVGTALPTETELMVAKAVDLGFKFGKTRSQLLLPDQKDLLDEFKKQLSNLAAGLHPWQSRPFTAPIGEALKRLAAAVDDFQRRSVIDRFVDAMEPRAKTDRAS